MKSTGLVTSPISRVTIRDVGNAPKKYADFGRRLKMAREALFDGDARAFARSIGLNDQTYRNYERGDRYPDDKTVRILAEEGISLHWLFLEQKPMLDHNQKQQAVAKRQTA